MITIQQITTICAYKKQPLFYWVSIIIYIIFLPYWFTQLLISLEGYDCIHYDAPMTYYSFYNIYPQTRKD